MNKNNNILYFYPSISESQWETILCSDLCSDSFIDILSVIYHTNAHRLNASVIAEILGYGHFAHLNSIVGRLGHKIFDQLKLTDAPRKNDGTVRWWNLVFDGEDVFHKSKLIRCDWILKEQMIVAIEKLGILLENKMTDSRAYRYRALYQIHNEYKNLSNLTGKERKSIVKVRMNQGKVRSNAIRRYKECVVCGIKTTAVLRASHIKQWPCSTPEEKGDIENTLLLCPNHDALFDKYLISFSDNGLILINRGIKQEDKDKLGINESLSIAISEKTKPYMEHHRAIFMKLYEQQQNHIT